MERNRETEFDMMNQSLDQSSFTGESPSKQNTFLIEKCVVKVTYQPDDPADETHTIMESIKSTLFSCLGI